MKYCWHCGKENQDEARYCRHCGAQFALAESAVATPATPYPQASGFAIASLVLGILWLYWIGSILALVFGYLARGEIRRDPQRVGGRGMAMAGIVLGWVGVATLVAAVSFFIWTFRQNSDRPAPTQTDTTAASVFPVSNF